MNGRGSSFKKILRKLYLSVISSHRLAVLDYSIEPKTFYPQNKPHQKLKEFIATNDEKYKALLKKALDYSSSFFSIKDAAVEKDPLQPAWNNDYVPGLDIVMLYTLLNTFQPKKYVEIGSGTTTKTAYKARKENNLQFSITCIDPFPRQEIKAVADDWQEEYIQKASLELFKNLSENDIVFFDGTHTLLPNSDVTWFFLEVLPILPTGVVVQIHDIYIPYDYPQFMLDRYYSENYILGAVLLANPDKYEVIAPNFYISEQPQLANILQPLWQHPSLQKVERHGGSFWFKVK
jgi:hypothetical protein